MKPLLLARLLWSLYFLQHSYMKSISQLRLGKVLKRTPNPVKSRLDKKQALIAAGVTKLTANVPVKLYGLVFF